MAVQSKAYLKSRFERGDLPSQQDYIDLIDSMLSANGEDWPDPLFASSAVNLREIAKDQVPNPWVTVAGTTGYVDARHVVQSGNRVDLVPVGTRVRLTLDSGYVYSETTAAAYDGGTDTTSIAIFDAVATLSVSRLDASIFLPASAGGALSTAGTVASQTAARRAIGLPPLSYGRFSNGPIASGGNAAGLTYQGPAFKFGTGAPAVIWSNTITSKTPAAWAAGSGNGGCVDGGACLANTWYYVYAVVRSDTGEGDAAFTASPPFTWPIGTLGSLPAAYDISAELGWLKTDGAGAFVDCSQASVLGGNQWLAWGASVLDVNATNPGTGEVTATLTAPPWSVAIVNASVSSPSIQTYGNIGSKNHALDAPSVNASNISVASGGFAAGQFFIPLDANRQMRYRFSASDASLVVNMRTIGWLDRHGVNL